MDRWTGILKVPLYSNSSIYCRVAASLCLSPSSKSLSVPAANAIFFNGDKIEGTNPVIRNLLSMNMESQNLKDADGFPASSSIVLLLWNCLKEAKSVISGKQKEPYQAEVSHHLHTPRTLLLGFSKGGTVLNQLVTELGFASVQLAEDVALANKNVANGGLVSQPQDQIIPNSKDGFLNSIAEFHYIDDLDPEGERRVFPAAQGSSSEEYGEIEIKGSVYNVTVVNFLMPQCLINWEKYISYPEHQIIDYSMNDRKTLGIWSAIERKCHVLLQQRNSKATLLRIHAMMLRNAIENNVSLLTKLISSFSVSDPVAGITHARCTDRSRQKDETFLCNTMIKSHMVLLNLLNRYFLLLEGLEIHNHVLKCGLASNLFVSTSLVDMYGKFGEMAFARKLFDEMPQRSPVSWTALIGGYLKCGCMGIAEGRFDAMPEKDIGAFNMMIDAYLKKGDILSAQRLFEAMPERDMGTTLEPDGVTVVSVLPAIADLGALDLGNWVHQYVKRKKLDRSSNVCTALVDMYAKCGEIAKAREFLMSLQTMVDWWKKEESVSRNGEVWAHSRKLSTMVVWLISWEVRCLEEAET
ncbi:hypothetical protein HAX54_017834 [Datura stramonium]|uniref:Pentatricopeptide repeat-containing protein n=1 Tax=Datura stramonium TaxID=4076 RepID=A0ABS8S0T9_DATST|nr:hypothetical protein [Datura stramonium]